MATRGVLAVAAAGALILAILYSSGEDLKQWASGSKGLSLLAPDSQESVLLQPLPQPPVLNISIHDILVEVNELKKQVETLALLSDSPPPAVTRLVFSETDIAAREYVKSKMQSAGLSVREDAIGNIFGRWEGPQPQPLLAPVLTGSHTDAIPHAGKWDGVVGVLGAVEAVRALQRAGFVPRRPIEAVMFTSEEPTRFGLGCMGSRLLAGQPGLVEHLQLLADVSNVTVVQAAAAAGYPAALDPAALRLVALPHGSVASFVELHIEQGPRLEREGFDIGVVTHIAAPSTTVVDWQGTGGHAGGVKMRDRSDAVLAAAELALAVERAALATGSADTVGTVGHLVVHPNAVNSIPLRVHMQIDVRDIDGPRRDRLLAGLRGEAERIAARRNVQLERFEVVNADAAVAFSPAVLSAIVAAVEDAGLKFTPIVSRAYHDAPFMAQLAPAAMIFIPCHRGISHSPEEAVADKDLQNGVQVLASTLARLSLM